MPRSPLSASPSGAVALLPTEATSPFTDFPSGSPILTAAPRTAQESSAAEALTTTFRDVPVYVRASSVAGEPSRTLAWPIRTVPAE